MILKSITSHSPQQYIHSLLGLLLALIVTSGCHSQAFDDDDFTAHDFEILYGETALNDILPSGQRTFSFVSQPNWGEFQWINTSTGSFSYYAPPESFRFHNLQVDSFSYQACVNDICYQAAIEIQLRFDDQNPYAERDTIYVETATMRMGDVTINDGDPDTLSDPVQGEYQSFGVVHPLYARIDLTPIDSFPQRNGNFYYQPVDGFIGEDFFTYYRQEPAPCNLPSTPARVTIFVVPNNLNPICTNGSISNALEEISSTLDLHSLSNDPENDNLYFQITVPPHGGSATISSNGTLSYTGNNNFIGNDTLQYAVVDLVGQTDSAYIFIHVLNNNNDRPSLQNSLAQTYEDVPQTFSIETADLVDGDELSYTSAGSALHGVFTITEAGLISYIPDTNFNGTDQLIYQGCDPGNLCDTATITILVLPSNDAPVASDDFNVILNNGILTSNAGSNDGDIDTPFMDLTFQLNSGPENGAVSIEANGSYTYLPNPLYIGMDSFTYFVCDIGGACDLGVVSITVLSSNAAPITESVNTNTNEDEPLLIALQPQTSDINGGDLFYQIISPGTEGIFTSIDNFGFSFEPSENFNGIFETSFRVCDTDNACDTATITINVHAINDSPIGVTQSWSINEDGSLIWSPSFSDPDSDILIFNIIQSPQQGVFINDNIYIPQQDYYGSDSLTYQVCDDYGACISIAESIYIYPINDFPIAQNDELTMQEDTPLSSSAIVYNDSDAESDILYYSLISFNGNHEISMSTTGNLYIQPGLNFNGTIEITISVCDPWQACDTATIIVYVGAINDAPTTTFPTISISEDSSHVFNPSEFANDIENDAITFTLVSSSEVNASFDITTHSYLLQSTTNFFGNGDIVIRTCDIYDQCTNDTISIIITPVNDAPVALPGSEFTFQDMALTGTLSGLVTDIDDNTFMPQVLEIVHGSMEIDSTLIFNYTPNTLFIGTDTITFMVCDLHGLCDSSQFIIQVYPPNQAPIAIDSSVIGCQGDSFIFNLYNLVSDDAQSPSTLAYSYVANSPAEILLDSETGELLVTPSLLFSGQLSIILTVCDNAVPSLCDDALLTIYTTPTHTPVFTEALMQNVSCFGLNDGVITITMDADSISTVYNWDNGLYGHSIENLSGGTYSVTISSIEPCSTPNYAQFIINEPPLLLITTSSSNINDSSNGSINLEITGGVSPYDVNWTGPGGFIWSGISINNLTTAGKYVATAIDANGCVAQASQQITAIEESHLTNVITYPNPVSDNYVHVLLDKTTTLPFVYRIEDMAGHVALSGQLFNLTTLLDINNLADGYYFLRSESGSVLQKIARQSR